MALAEYGVACTLAEERPWTPTQTLFDYNPSGILPVLIEDTGFAVCGVEALSEYLEETQSGAFSLLKGSALQRAEIRRLVAWYDVKFYTEVSEPLISEKVVRRFLSAENGGGAPDMARVRQARLHLISHLNYLSYLVEENSWLAGDDLSLADLAAAAHISALDYLGDMPWAEHAVVKSWYQRIKSRPSFRVLLQDNLGAMPPSSSYADLDF